MSFTIAHISDPHFHSFPKNWQQWASKRALGAANLFFRRRRHYPLARAQKLVKVLQALQWDHLVISGDITTLALEEEFQLASQTLLPLLGHSEKVTIIPGNHDRYINEGDQADYFQQYFGDFFSKTAIKTQQLTDDWHLIGWDSTHANDWLTASGTVTQTTLRASERYIQSQPVHTRFVLVNHYPLWFPPNHPPRVAHELHNLAQVLHWVKQQSQIEIYLHGHIHANWIHQMNRETTPLYFINSASSTSTAQAKPPHKSAFHRIHLESSQIQIEPLQF